MSKGQTLRALVTERLSAAAEDIFVLFERTIVEYEEELCRSKEENQRKQQLLDKVLTLRVELFRGNFQIPSTSPGPGLNQEITETPQINEEQSVKQEDEQLKKHQCNVCNKRFHTKYALQIHIRVHTKEKPYSCSICYKSFSTSSSLVRHKRTHTGEKPYHCTVCMKSFSDKSSLEVHRKRHTGERPFSCPMCEKQFILKSNLEEHKRRHTGDKPFSCSFFRHKRTHTGEKPYKCTVCMKSFTEKYALEQHRKYTQATDHSGAHL
uniref:C2H2-type domain-containing protein n=1 Tax=Neogobius melanostomus TaxID=47308 RepID=A0A8C6T5A4_9GOBI